MIPAAYEEFIERKTQLGGFHGFDPVWMPDILFDFQKSLTEWAIKKGRAAILADCGLGKTPMQLTWAENIVRKTNGRVLVLAPLGVAAQTVREAEKFGIEAARSGDGTLPKAKIVVTNYERLHLFNACDFEGAVCDESSILKSFNGKRKAEITAFMRKLRYRLLATATAAPNDYIELGTSSEALGYLGHIDMLNRFFKNDQNNSAVGRHFGQAVKFRFKGHAELPFWRWVCSWARAIRKPSDLGFSDEKFVLPQLIEKEYFVKSNHIAPGKLFPLPAVGLKEQREEQRCTLKNRCEMVAALVAHTGKPALAWCNMNDEGKLLSEIIPDAVEVSGADCDESKEEKFLAFISGEIRVLITKPKIGAWGLNFQHCAHTTFFPSHSFEQYYQGVRRFWRFGQINPVRADVITTEGGLEVLKNLQRKAIQADAMFSRLTEEMNRAISIQRSINFTKKEELPSWL